MLAAWRKNIPHNPINIWNEKRFQVEYPVSSVQKRFFGILENLIDKGIDRGGFSLMTEFF